MVARGTFRTEFLAPAVVGSYPSGVEGGLKVALSGSRIAYVAWRGAQWTIATAHGARFSAGRPLGLPQNSELDRLAYGLHGPVDAFWYRLSSNGDRVLGWYWTRLDANGGLGRTFAVAHHNHPDPCRLPATQGLYERVPSPPLVAPRGYQVATYLQVTCSDGRGSAVSLWNDFGHSNTHGMFAAFYRP